MLRAIEQFCVFALAAIGLISQTIAQEHIAINLSVVEIDENGERPAVGKMVIIIPKDQGVMSGYTNINGKIEFEFEPTESVVFRVGKTTQSVRLQPLSGRISQNTSYIDDKRRTRDQAFYPASTSAGELDSIKGILIDIENRAGGRLMNAKTREFVQSLRREIIEATQPLPNQEDWIRARDARYRKFFVSRIDSLLAPPRRMRATYESNSSGVRLTEVDGGGPAQKAGLQPGDVVTHVDNISLRECENSFAWLIANSQSLGIELTVRSSGRERTVNVNPDGDPLLSTSPVITERVVYPTMSPDF
ncbi:PDZ domain-containing protein [Allorhodopirellula solitaria]|uniref:PDZ domain-containing protein n=1 Tax=Allorhodopirellula solitaria TaxID=2527987 RepID=A0A5C5YHC9_9BACT|nr:PDZ domain-containing protein [Allorhodopirellula solitaria]TWT73975.1 hypothetical protein CA85_08580 [Allorhodopirellula solitaria]